MSAWRLFAVVFHSRVISVNFSLAAVTLNVSPKPVLPVLTEEPPRHQKPRLLTPEPTEPRIGNRDGRLICRNSHYEITLNCRQGFSIERIVNRAVPDAEIALHPSSGLALELEGSEITATEHDQLVGADKERGVATGSRILTGRAFRTTSVDVNGTEATIALASEDKAVPLAVRITVSVDDSEELALGLHVENKGDAPLKTSVWFPTLNRLTIGSVEDAWLFFPKYRTVLTNERRFVRSFHGLEEIQGTCGPRRLRRLDERLPRLPPPLHGLSALARPLLQRDRQASERHGRQGDLPRRVSTGQHLP